MVKDGSNPGQTPRAKRHGGTQALARLAPRLARKALGKRGFAAAGVITDWPAIVGPDLARVSQPEKLTFAKGKRAEGTLHLRAAGAAALELQHLHGLLMERVNAYFGYRAVARIRLIQVPPRPRNGPDGPSRPPSDAPLPAAETARLDALAGGLEDERLQAVIRRLGAAVLRREMAMKTKDNR